MEIVNGKGLEMTKKIGIMGSSQIMHIIPLLQPKYDVINLQKVLDNEPNRFIRRIKFARALMKVDVVYNVFVDNTFARKAKLAKCMRKKVIGHWIGTDARLADEGKIDLRKLSNIDVHLACFEPLKEQMGRLGVKATTVPIVPFKFNFDVCDMPKEHRVLIYLPTNKENEYGFQEIAPVIKAHEELQFDIVANENEQLFKEMNNVKLWRWVSIDEMEKIYNNISIVMRIHLNDGLSMSVLEAMAKGKKVIWNCDFDFCYPGATTGDITKSLDAILNQKPEVDYEAHNYIIENYSKEKILCMYQKVFD